MFLKTSKGIEQSKLGKKKFLLDNLIMDSELSDPSVSDDRVEHRMGMSILDLNEHCLLQVLSHLDVYDAINFGETCKLLHAVSRLAMIQYKDFVLIDHLTYAGRQEISRNLPPVPPLRKVLSYMAPYIEVLDARTEKVRRNHNISSRLDPEVMRERAEPLHIFLQFDMPKIKSIIVEYSEHLGFIASRQTIKKLTIFNVNGNDIYNYASGMRNLTQLHLFNIYVNVSINDISVLVDNNPNIEDLCLIAELPSFWGRALEFPVKLIQKLPQLKQLELTIGRNVEILEFSVQIKQLTKLALVTRYPYQDGNRYDKFWRKLAQKNTVRSLELRDVAIGDHRQFETLASMNLTSLLIETSSYYKDFFWI